MTISADKLRLSGSHLAAKQSSHRRTANIDTHFTKVTKLSTLEVRIKKRTSHNPKVREGNGQASVTHQLTPAIGQLVASSVITLNISLIEEHKEDFKSKYDYPVKVHLEDETKHEELVAAMVDDGLDTAAGRRREQLAVLAVLSQDISSNS